MMRLNVLMSGLAFLALSSVGGEAVAAQQTRQPPVAATPATDPAQPGTTTASYQDWLMRCDLQADKTRVCEVVQTLQAEGQQGVVASVVVGRPDPKAAMRLVIQVLRGVWLPSGIRVQVDKASKPLQLGYDYCTQTCVASLTLDAATLQSLKSATAPGSFTFDASANHAITLPLSFKGFAAALDASMKS